MPRGMPIFNRVGITVCNSAYDMEDNMSDTITIKDPGHPGVQAAFLKAHLRMLSFGLKHSRMPAATILLKASALTGKPYKRGQYDAAIADLNSIING